MLSTRESEDFLVEAGGSGGRQPKRRKFSLKLSIIAVAISILLGSSIVCGVIAAAAINSQAADDDDEKDRNRNATLGPSAWPEGETVEPTTPPNVPQFHEAENPPRMPNSAQFKHGKLEGMSTLLCHEDSGKPSFVTVVKGNLQSDLLFTNQMTIIHSEDSVANYYAEAPNIQCEIMTVQMTDIINGAFLVPSEVECKKEARDGEIVSNCVRFVQNLTAPVDAGDFRQFNSIISSETMGVSFMTQEGPETDGLAMVWGTDRAPNENVAKLQIEGMKEQMYKM